MTWITIVAAILSFLGPIIQALIERFLNEAAQDMPALSPDRMAVSNEEIDKLFDKAYKKTGYFQWFRQAILLIAKKAAKGKAMEFSAAAKTRTEMRPITLDEAYVATEGTD